MMEKFHSSNLGFFISKFSTKKLFFTKKNFVCILKGSEKEYLRRESYGRGRGKLWKGKVEIMEGEGGNIEGGRATCV